MEDALKQLKMTGKRETLFAQNGTGMVNAFNVPLEVIKIPKGFANKSIQTVIPFQVKQANALAVTKVLESRIENVSKRLHQQQLQIHIALNGRDQSAKNAQLGHF